MKITEEMKQAMFENWNCNNSLTAEKVRSFREMNEQERVGFCLREGFTAALDLILPLLEKSLEANTFYAAHTNWRSEANPETELSWIRSDDIVCSQREFIFGDETPWFCSGGKTARTALAEIESEIKKWGKE
jgi:hypothetical protein